MNKNLFSKILCFMLVGTGLAFAANNNPYTFFNSGSAASPNISSPPSQSIVTNVPTPPQNLPSVAPLAAESSPPIQYVQAASQVGQFSGKSSTSPPSINTLASQKPNANAQNPGSAFGIMSEQPSTQGIEALLTQIVTITGNTANGIPAIATNTESTATNTSNAQASLQKLVDYWTALPQDKFLNETLGFGSLLNFNQNSTNASSTLSAYTLQGLLPQLQPLKPWTDVANESSNISINDNFPYLSSLTENLSSSSISNDLWVPSVTQSLLDLSTNQQNMTDLQKVLLAPFTGTDWSQQVQSATTPQLLRMLVTEQAVNNALAYQVLQRENDQTLMQASQLRVLNEINNTQERMAQEQIIQEKRIVDAIAAQEK